MAACLFSRLKFGAFHRKTNFRKLILLFIFFVLQILQVFMPKFSCWLMKICLATEWRWMFEENESVSTNYSPMHNLIVAQYSRDDGNKTLNMDTSLRYLQWNIVINHPGILTANSEIFVKLSDSFFVKNSIMSPQEWLSQRDPTQCFKRMYYIYLHHQVIYVKFVP